MPVSACWYHTLSLMTCSNTGASLGRSYGVKPETGYSARAPPNKIMSMDEIPTDKLTCLWCFNLLLHKCDQHMRNRATVQKKTDLTTRRVLMRWKSITPHFLRTQANIELCHHIVILRDGPPIKYQTIGISIPYSQIECNARIGSIQPINIAYNARHVLPNRKRTVLTINLLACWACCSLDDLCLSIRRAMTATAFTIRSHSIQSCWLH